MGGTLPRNTRGKKREPQAHKSFTREMGGESLQPAAWEPVFEKIAETNIHLLNTNAYLNRLTKRDSDDLAP